MSAIEVFTKKPFAAITTKLLDESCDRITQEFRDLLNHGNQRDPLPGGVVAAGQYLRPNEINQRGLYGTAAAILALALGDHRLEDFELLGGVFDYLRRRREIEESLTVPDADFALLRGRVLREQSVVFKKADLLYAISKSPDVIKGRESFITQLASELDASRTPEGGWGPTQAADDHDPIATALVLRALNASSAQIRADDWNIAKMDALNENSPPEERVLSFLALAEGNQLRGDVLDAWPSMEARLLIKLNGLSEFVHRYRLGNRWEEIRVPWEAYTVKLGALAFGVRWLLKPKVQRWLLLVSSQLTSLEGFSYDRRGLKSTRTYSVLMDLLVLVRGVTARSALFLGVAYCWNGLDYAFRSRGLRLLLGIGAVGLAAYSLIGWLQGRSTSIAQVGPEIAASLIMGVIAAVRRR